MNAPLLVQPVSAPDCWSEANAAVNAWRGRCIDVFARAEASVSETMLVYAGAASSRFPHLVGQRFEALFKVINDEGNSKAVEALAAFRLHDPLRSFLCHGVGKVTLDRDGDWQVVIRLLTFRTGVAERKVLVVDQVEAGPIAASLHKDWQRLDARLATLRKARLS